MGPSDERRVSARRRAGMRIGASRTCAPVRYGQNIHSFRLMLNRMLAVLDAFMDPEPLCLCLAGASLILLWYN